MYILPISDDLNQTFSFSGQYNTSLQIKCHEVECINDFTSTPIMDVYIDGFPPVYGVPMVPYVDLLQDQIRARCIPYDYGSLMVIADEGVDVTCDLLASGDAALIYLNAAEVVYSSLYIPDA